MIVTRLKLSREVWYSGNSPYFVLKIEDIGKSIPGELNCLSSEPLLKNGYIDLLDTESKVIKEIDDLDKMKSLTGQLVDFYSLLDNRDIQERFKNITLDACKEKLNNDNFQDKLYLYRYLLQKHRTNINCLREINLLNNVSLCPLCFQDHIDHVILPCGHTFCKKCVDRCVNCGVCRGNINKKQKIFIL